MPLPKRVADHIPSPMALTVSSLFFALFMVPSLLLELLTGRQESARNIGISMLAPLAVSALALWAVGPKRDLDELYGGPHHEASGEAQAG